jgi:predicted ATP-dependent endonuclease of OLD family
MYIKNIQFQNFKCYEDFTLHLEKGVNVLFGMNASGKTSILKGLNIAVSHFLEKYGLEPKLIKNTDARLLLLKICVILNIFFPVSIKTEYINSNRTIEKWEYRKEAFTKETISNSTSRISNENITENIKLPIITFFPTSRLFNQSLEKDTNRYYIQFFGAEK